MARTTVKEKEEVISSKNLLDSFLKENKDEHFVYVQPKHIPISTGSLILDSLVTIRSGGVVRLVGKGAELGKSSQAFVLASNYMKTMPNSKTLMIKAEARLTPEIIARSGLNFVFKPEDWNAGSVFVYSCNVFESMAEMLESIMPQMHENDENLCVIIDSLDGLILRDDKKKAVWAEQKSGNSVKVAGVPLLTKLLFRRLGLLITHYDCLMLVTGQFSADIKLDPYSSNVPRQVESSGGNAIAHQSDYVFQYLPRYNSDYILENPDEKPDYLKNRTVGIYATIEIKKSGTDVSGTKVKIPIKKNRVGNAIWIEREVVDILLSWEQIEKNKSWLKVNPTLLEEIKNNTGFVFPEQVQGINSLYKILEEQKKVTEFLVEKFKKIITI